ncbi:hypothetical protein [Actinoplanes italicus]|uniref:hypothetical protein n=1 Tax=Actinoplanes italicus TaxID=113567 RepID=UPI0011B289DC|nr:hypothetical protein [Actinoplanes italicus]
MGARRAIVAWRAAHPESDVAGSVRRVLHLEQPSPAPDPDVATDTIVAVPSGHEPVRPPDSQ